MTADSNSWPRNEEIPHTTVQDPSPRNESSFTADRLWAKVKLNVVMKCRRGRPRCCMRAPAYLPALPDELAGTPSPPNPRPRESATPSAAAKQLKSNPIFISYAGSQCVTACWATTLSILKCDTYICMYMLVPPASLITYHA